MRRIWARRGLAGALATLAFVAACGGGDDSEEASSGNREGNGESTTTAAESTTTTVAAVGPAEWIEVVNELNAQLADLYADPDPDRVGELMAEACPCYEQHTNNMAAIADEGQRIVGDPNAVLFVQEEATYDDGSVRLTIKIRPGEAQLLDRNGEVLQEFSEDAEVPPCSSILLKPDGPNGTYRVHDEVALDGCPPEAG